MVTQVPSGKLMPLSVPDYCWQHVTMDLITHLPRTDRDVDAIATFVDRLSKFTYFSPVKMTINTAELTKIFLS